eukprot:TRINITY_DN311_c0_g1_i4.p1 TRINITY_DN311_c0_g1~~TRINITY_DN311_c0_g1_i4.p1  ORF type:complete len:1193 (-),score=184.72 TRINITY_DN311_c0_g1_i4:15-3593(-)
MNMNVNMNMNTMGPASAGPMSMGTNRLLMNSNPTGTNMSLMGTSHSNNFSPVNPVGTNLVSSNPMSLVGNVSAGNTSVPHFMSNNSIHMSSAGNLHNLMGTNSTGTNSPILHMRSSASNSPMPHPMENNTIISPPTAHVIGNNIMSPPAHGSMLNSLSPPTAHGPTGTNLMGPPMAHGLTGTNMMSPPTHGPIGNNLGPSTVHGANLVSPPTLGSIGNNLSLPTARNNLLSPPTHGSIGNNLSPPTHGSIGNNLSPPTHESIGNNLSSSNVGNNLNGLTVTNFMSPPTHGSIGNNLSPPTHGNNSSLLTSENFMNPLTHASTGNNLVSPLAHGSAGSNSMSPLTHGSTGNILSPPGNNFPEPNKNHVGAASLNHFASAPSSPVVPVSRVSELANTTPKLNHTVSRPSRGPPVFTPVSSAPKAPEHLRVLYPDLTKEQRAHLKREADAFRGITPLVHPPEYQGDLGCIGELTVGMSAIFYPPHDEPPSTVTLRLADKTLLYYASYGFIYLKYIKEIKLECNSEILKNKRASPSSDSFVAIYYSNTTLCFEFATPRDRDIFLKIIIALTKKLKATPTIDDYAINLWDTHQWESSMSRSSFVKFFKANVDSSFRDDSEFEKKWQVVMGNQKDVTRQKFIELIRELGRYSEELRPIWDKYSCTGIMTSEQFLKFLINEQKESMTISEAESIISNFTGSKEKHFTLKQFYDFCQSELNSAMHPDFNLVRQDMSLPMPWYYINSSHNTYCSGDQLTDKSSVEMYARVLRDGCRCVELDCWNGTDNSPDILHGRTLTSKIKVRDVIKCIRDNAFLTSKYPVILSLENHMNHANQQRMVKDLLEILGPMLATVPTVQDKIPSPEDLVYKVILKGSPVVVGNEISPDGTVSDIQTGSTRICEELARVTYLKSSHQNLEAPSKNGFEMMSVDEVRVEGFLKRNIDQVVKYNNDQLCRTYPKATRIDSSNYSPNNGWLVGCHMVALNWQAWGDYMWLNQARFSANGNCGWLMKSPFMVQRPDTYFPDDGGSAAHNNNPNSTLVSVTVEIISGRFLPEPSSSGFNTHLGHQKVVEQDSSKTIKKFKGGKGISTVVSMKCFGVEADTSEIACQAMPITSLFSTKFDGKLTFPFYASEMATLVFRCDLKFPSTITGGSKKKHLWNFSIPAEAIRGGYRIFPVNNAWGNPIPNASVLVHIRKDTKDR